MSHVELEEVQGLVLSSYKDRPAAAYALFHVTDRERAQAWLGRLVDRVQYSDFLKTQRDQEPRLAELPLNVAFTHAGLAAMGLPPEALAGFLDAFQEGMSTEPRARQLGDDRASHPTRWAWGGPGSVPVDGVLLAFGGEGQGTQADIEALEAFLAGEVVADHGLALVKLLPAQLLRADRKEHFGFRDGISNPSVGGLGHRPWAPRSEEELAPGEFLLGYKNLYDQLGLTPRVRAERDPSSILSVDGPHTHDFGRNGSFLVFRQLAQDVEAFERYTADTGERLGVEAEWVGAHLVGRWKNGLPLTTHPEGGNATPQAVAEHFLYTAHGDDTGARCPIGAHIRRTNPRDTMLPEPHDQPLSGDPHDATVQKDRLMLTNRRRILRRGRSYEDATGEKGLFFLCFASNLRRQFEFVQSMWAVNPNFAGLASNPDPMLGVDREVPYPATALLLQGTAHEPPQTLAGLGRFVETRGGAYFFMPGRRSLRFLAAVTPLPEHEAPGEAKDAQASAELHASKVERDYRSQPAATAHAPRGFHVKAHGILQAELRVREDLPESYRQGVFARPGERYGAWVRVSSSAFGRNPDSAPDIHGIAVKLVGVEGPRALGGFEQHTQDFLLIDSPYLMVGTIAAALAFDTAAVANRLPWHLLTHLGELRKLMVMRRTPRNPLEGTYTSVAPFRLGDRVVRWGLRVANGVTLAQPAPGISHLREALREQLARSAEVPLELCVQVRAAGDQPIDDGSVDWATPMERIADLVLRREGFDTEAQEALGEKMSFNPWNALEAHRPLGNLNRARRIVYRAVYAKRTELNHLQPFEPPAPPG